MTFRFVNNIWKEIKLEISPLFNSLTEVSELLWTIISEVYHVQLCSRACCRICRKSRNLCWSADLCGAMLSANGLTCAIQPKFSCQLTDWPLWSRLSHQSHKQTPTDGRETKFSPQSVTANQRGNTGITSSHNLEIISTLNRCWSENIFGHLEKNILVIVIKNIDISPD